MGNLEMFWDGGAAMKACETVSEYKSVCALDRGESITALTARFGLPHHQSPGADPDRQGVAAAWAALNGGRTGSAMTGNGIPAARAHLQRHRSAFGMGAEATGSISFVDDEEVVASFRANPEKRTISGLLVPWGKVAKSGFAKWRFQRDSLRFGDVTRVKLNVGHERNETVGHAVRLQPSAVGLEGTFQIGRGPKGDQALMDAEDKLLDGFSIEVDFEDGDGWTEDPTDSEVRLVGSSKLVAAALTGYPAFDDARVDRIAAARREGTTMQADKEPEETMEDDAPQAFETALARLADAQAQSQANLAENLSQSIGESVSAGMKAALENLGDSERGTVRAARYAVTREEPVYRFDGSGHHSIVRDAWYAATAKDDDAIERLRKFRRQSEEVQQLYSSVQFTPQTTSSASNIVPPGYRPDLYVTQLQQGRPFVQAGSQGTIANATPFTVPVFTSATSVTADHVEGTNPSDGSLAFATKTVTPQAISGRLTLSREIVDSSNPAIDQIALAAMRESYARQTETKVYTLLNGANGAGGTITTGLVPSGAQAATYVGTTGTPPALIAGIRSRLAAYPFARFASPTVALMGANATSILATAADSTGRPMYPFVGATNAAGMGTAADQAWSVDGLTFIPAWAASGTAAGDTQIFILNRSDLWVWESPLLSFRFEEKQGPANIELNVFGYFATHLLRPVGLSGIRVT